jgi:hypothetical protein
VSSNSVQQERLLVHCTCVGELITLLRFSFITVQTRLAEEKHFFSIRMFLFWIHTMQTPGVKNSSSLSVVSTVRVGRQRNRSSIPLQDNIFLCSFYTGFGAHPASYVVGFEGVERPVCETDRSI